MNIKRKVCFGCNWTPNLDLLLILIAQIFIPSILSLEMQQINQLIQFQTSPRGSGREPFKAFQARENFPSAVVQTESLRIRIPRSTLSIQRHALDLTESLTKSLQSLQAPWKSDFHARARFPRNFKCLQLKHSCCEENITSTQLRDGVVVGWWCRGLVGVFVCEKRQEVHNQGSRLSILCTLTNQALE